MAELPLSLEVLETKKAQNAKCQHVVQYMLYSTWSFCDILVQTANDFKLHIFQHMEERVHLRTKISELSSSELQTRAGKSSRLMALSTSGFLEETGEADEIPC